MRQEIEFWAVAAVLVGTILAMWYVGEFYG